MQHIIYNAIQKFGVSTFLLSFFLKEINTFFQEGCVNWIKSLLFLNLYPSKNQSKKYHVPKNNMKLQISFNTHNESAY